MRGGATAPAAQSALAAMRHLQQALPCRPAQLRRAPWQLALERRLWLPPQLDCSTAALRPRRHTPLTLILTLRMLRSAMETWVPAEALLHRRRLPPLPLAWGQEQRSLCRQQQRRQRTAAGPPARSCCRRRCGRRAGAALLAALARSSGRVALTMLRWTTATQAATLAALHPLQDLLPCSCPCLVPPTAAPCRQPLGAAAPGPRAMEG